MEIGFIDFLLEVSIVLSHMVSPQERYMRELLHIFGYLKKLSTKKIYLDLSYRKVSENWFECFGLIFIVIVQFKIEVGTWKKRTRS